MAYDKVIDSAQLEADLKTVADSIRAKAGTTDELDFPLGFKSAVDGISTGVPINNQNKTITQNGTYTADEGFTGLGTVSVNVARDDQVDIEQMFIDVIEGDATNITLPSGLTKISNYMFDYNGNLVSVSLPDGVTSIGNNAFYQCSNLASISLPNSITSIGNTAFYYCGKLALTSLPDGLTKISEGAFYQTTKLALTSLPDGITSIGKQAFMNSGFALTSLPNGLKTIGDEAFSYCSKLIEITLPETLTSIGMRAFAYCYGLTEVTFKSKPNSMGAAVFYYCNNLLTINVPWAEGEVSGAPWGATKAEIRYNYTGE